MKSAHVAAIVIAGGIIAALAFVLVPRSDDIASIEEPVAPPVSPELLQGTGPALETHTPARESKEQEAPRGSWIVRGRVTLGFKDPAPGQQITAKGYDGFEAKGTPVREAKLTSDKDGRFAWALPAPTHPMALEFSVKDGLSTDDALALPDAPPPDAIKLYILKRDAKIVGRVTDMEGRSIAGAEILTYRRKPVACADDGTFEIAVSSVGSDARVNARAPGYALRRASASISGPGSVARLEIKLPKEFRVTGIVTDPEGRTVEGAVVKTFMTSFLNKAITNARGEYVLGNLDPGRPKHSLFARHAEFTEARSNVVTTGDSVKVDLQLGMGVRVAGQVTDTDGTELEGASLYIGFSRSAYNRLDALAKDAGHFEFPVVEPGSQMLVASRPGYASTRQVIEVKRGDETLTNLKVVLGKGRSVSGRVVDASGRPVAGVRLSWKHKREYLSRRIATDTEGRFEGHNLPFNGLGAEVWGESITRLQQALPDGMESLRDVILTVKSSGKLAGRVVDAQTGEPVKRFVVRLVPPEARPGDPQGYGYSATWSREGHRFSDTDGYWDTTGEQLVLGAAYGVEVSAKGYATTTNRRVLAEVSPKKDATVFRLAPGAVLTGTVVDATTQEPVAGAVVKLFDKANPIRQDDVHGRKTARTDAKGNFRIGDLPAGETNLNITHPEFAPLNHGPLSITSSAEVRVGRISLNTGGRVEGVAANDEGEVLVGLRVEAILIRQGPRPTSHTWQTLTDEEGRFHIDKLPPGTLTVRSMNPRPSGQTTSLGVRYSLRIAVEAGKTTTVRLVPSGSATLRGRLVFDGDLPDNLQVRLSPRGEPKRADRFAPVVNGAFSLARVDPGAYDLSCQHYQILGGNRQKRWYGQLDVTLEDNEVKDVELTLRGQ